MSKNKLTPAEIKALEEKKAAAVKSQEVIIKQANETETSPIR